eukprot:gnl/TRDRNA2_/TRDRNA2_167280_c1_seq1.p1 gnl/TRDRNA2_/TRDRNA2_167280_c1~~gnl/TRDRNA2_/TRDRNA2_167280_c1_seq1.p1  ORF type:complete len:106 (+),score=17.71 gnl/TRDRNA2_/TRDRNA2_167280_c1_seq1:83-400(+)
MQSQIMSLWQRRNVGTPKADGAQGTAQEPDAEPHHEIGLDQEKMGCEPPTKMNMKAFLRMTSPVGHGECTVELDDNVACEGPYAIIMPRVQRSHCEGHDSLSILY